MSSSPRIPQIMIGTLIAIAGAGLLSFASVSTVSTYRFITTASKAEGKVSRISARDARSIIRFVPAGSKTAIEFTAKGFVTNYEVGDKVTVFYLPNAQEPSGFQINIDAFDALWFSQLFLALLGVEMIYSGLRIKHVA